MIYHHITIIEMLLKFVSHRKHQFYKDQERVQVKRSLSLTIQKVLTRITHQ